MSDEPQKVNALPESAEPAETASASRESEEKKPLVSGMDASKAPVPTNLGVIVFTVLYILFVIAVCVGLIALSVFLFGKLWAWISG